MLAEFTQECHQISRVQMHSWSLHCNLFFLPKVWICARPSLFPKCDRNCKIDAYLAYLHTPMRTHYHIFVRIIKQRRLREWSKCQCLGQHKLLGPACLFILCKSSCTKCNFPWEAAPTDQWRSSRRWNCKNKRRVLRFCHFYQQRKL